MLHANFLALNTSKLFPGVFLTALSLNLPDNRKSPLKFEYLKGFEAKTSTKYP